MSGYSSYAVAPRALPRNPRAYATTWGGPLATLALVAVSYAFRVPPLLNARSTNSDAAVVGLQAMHMLRGEISPFLWGSGYQTSADAAWAALFFAVLGASPFVLMLSALTLHIASTWLVFSMLRRRFDPWLALLVVMPLVVSPSSVHSYALYPPRQLSLTLAMAAFWAIDNAAQRVRPRAAPAWLVAGGLLATLAVSADPYPMLLVPLICLHALLVTWPRVGRGLWFMAGGAAGLVPFLLVHGQPGAKSGPLGFTTTMLAHHFRLLVEECLPWALSYKVYFARNVMDYQPWDAPLWFRALGTIGALLLAALVVFGLLAPTRRVAQMVPLALRRLGFVGALAFPLAIGAFLVSVMVMDHFSMRYLVVLTLMTPFAVAPAAHALGARRFALVFVPHLVASAIAGWVGYGPFVRGAMPVVETPELRDDYALAATLRARGVRWATADYWASYRLTFLFREEIVVVPTNAGEDRYPPYRRAFEAQPVFAYVFDPGRSREDVSAAERELTSANEHVEKLPIGELLVFIVTRRR